jgi:nitroreductase
MDPIATVQEIKTADPDYDIADVFRQRWSPRAFTDRPVEPAKIRRMLKAAHWTMSSYNEGPLRLLGLMVSSLIAEDAAGTQLEPAFS